MYKATEDIKLHTRTGRAEYKKEFDEQYTILNYGILFWLDAAVHWRKEDIREFTTCNQESVGFVFFDKINYNFIVLQNHCEDPKNFDGIVIPFEWTIKFTPLKKLRSRKAGLSGKPKR